MHLINTISKKKTENECLFKYIKGIFELELNTMTQLPVCYLDITFSAATPRVTRTCCLS